MSKSIQKKIWDKTAFQSKNEMRKLYKTKNREDYLLGRRRRKLLTLNGCFGKFEPKPFNEVALGTGGFRE